MRWYLAVLKKYAVFEGRARRQELWMFILINLVIYLALVVVDIIIGLYDVASGLGLLSGIYSLAVLIPNLSVGARRLHDTGRTGWWLLIGFVPIAGAIVLIVFWAIDGAKGENETGRTRRWGPSPREMDRARLRRAGDPHPPDDPFHLLRLAVTRRWGLDPVLSARPVLVERPHFSGPAQVLVSRRPRGPWLEDAE